MVRVTEELSVSQEEVNLYHALDPHLGNLPVLIFHGPSTTTNSTQNSSRIQVHVLTCAGYKSYPRLTIDPNSPFYQSVNFLPYNQQGDDVCRGLVFALSKYFQDLSAPTKSSFIIHAASTLTTKKRPGSAPVLFSEQHAADLASAMQKVENIGEIMVGLQAALRQQHIQHMDVDLVLPPGSIAPFQEEFAMADSEELVDPTLKQYGDYAPLVKFFGEVTFLPTSKLRRAPSRPTSLIRSKSFLKDQKMSLRREMGELVDTEERYNIKIHELVHEIANEFRAKARARAFGSASPSEDDLKKLFPPCLDKILQVNSGFLECIQTVMDETEEEAMRDLEAPVATSTSSRYGGSGRQKDATGTLAFAKVLLEWFPQFEECYQEYISASQNFPQLISTFVNQQSSFSQRVQQTGEQRLRSSIIEPVQRLPRYSLFIDNILTYLPVTHPALQPMLKAKDMITSICSMDQATDKFQTVNRLQKLVESWPSSLKPSGRLVTAVDFVELAAPFHTLNSTAPTFSREGMLLLFADYVVVLRKPRDSQMTARAMMSELDKPSASVMMAPVTAAAGGQKYVYELAFAGWHALNDTRFTVSSDGHQLWMTSVQTMNDAGTGREQNQPPTIRVFTLKGSYEGKAPKLTDEITNARVEGRFSEAERESDKWSFRSTHLTEHRISLHTAVFEEGIDDLIPGRKDPAPIRVVIDRDKGTKGAPVGHYGVEIVGNIMGYSPYTEEKGKVRIECLGLNEKLFVDDHVKREQFFDIFTKRLGVLLKLQFGPATPFLTPSFISFYTKILKSLHVKTEVAPSKSFRPASPVKLFSNFLSSNFGSSTTSLNASLNASTSSPIRKGFGEIPSIKAPSMTRAESSKLIQSPSSPEFDGKSSVRLDGVDRTPVNPLVRLEETFTVYVGAIHNRKGNIVGKVLRNRHGANELAVNALYNTLVENPYDSRAASEADVDVLFVAFEKFLSIVWTDQMGQIMSLETMEALQERALRAYPGEFADYVKLVFGDMAPQNRRAFISMVKLLSSLLESCGNDGDRGALTVTFAELLVSEGQPHDYINLLDRLVEDAERLFDDIGPGAVVVGGGGNSNYGSISGQRSNHSNTGSLTSNASSLRRRFADTLLRSNSKTDSDNRPFMWRTLSKNSRSVATGETITPSSLSKASLNRSKSIESPSRRPISRDRPTVLGAFDERPSSSHEPIPRLSPIGASPPPDDSASPSKSSKKKRRSSLSDLKALMAAATLGESSPLGPISPESRLSRFNGSPRTPSPTKIPVAGGSIMDRNRSTMFRTGSPKQKENSPLGSSRIAGNLTEREQNIMSPPENVVVKELWSASKGHTKSSSISNIPTLRKSTRDPTPLSLRPTSSPQKTSPTKLRLQSPQKLRERLNVEKKAFEEGGAAFQSELAKISAEMAAQASRLGKNTPSSTLREIANMQAQLDIMRDNIERFTKEVIDKQERTQTVVDKSLQAADYKVRALDQLYKESTAENEILYEKMNAQLANIVTALKSKGKEGKEEMAKQILGATEETAKTQKENTRLRKDMLAAKTRLQFYGE